MVTNDNAKNTGTSRPRTGVPQGPAYSSDERARLRPPLFEPEPSPPAQTPRANDGVSIALTIGALGVLIGMLATHIVFPAISTLSNASVATRSGEGP